LLYKFDFLNRKLANVLQLLQKEVIATIKRERKKKEKERERKRKENVFKYFVF